MTLSFETQEYAVSGICIFVGHFRTILGLTLNLQTFLKCLQFNELGCFVSGKCQSEIVS